MANLYESRMRTIRHDPSVMEKELDACSAVKAWIRETATKMENTEVFTPTDIADIMRQWCNASIRTIVEDELPNERYPLYKKIDSAVDDFLIEGNYYCLFNDGESVRIFGEDKCIRVEPVQVVWKNRLVDIRLKTPNITLYFELRNQWKEHNLKYKLYQIIQTLW